MMPLLFSQISHNKTQVSPSSRNATQRHTTTGKTRTTTRDTSPPAAAPPADPTTLQRQILKIAFRPPPRCYSSGQERWMVIGGEAERRGRAGLKRLRWPQPSELRQGRSMLGETPTGGVLRPEISGVTGKIDKLPTYDDIKDKIQR